MGTKPAASTKVRITTDHSGSEVIYHTGRELSAAMKKIREEKVFDDIPIIVVSNSANDETVSKMMELGIDEYIIKAEHRLEEIINKMMEVLSKNQQ